MKVKRNAILILGLVLLQISSAQMGQKKHKAQEFPFKEEYWSVENADDTESEIQTLVYKNKSAIKLEPSQKGFSFTEESQIVFGNDVVRYIYDPKKMEALVFEEIDESIVFLDPRTWIHVKVEVIGNRASFYIEDME